MQGLTQQRAGSMRDCEATVDKVCCTYEHGSGHAVNTLAPRTTGITPMRQ